MQAKAPWADAAKLAKTMEWLMKAVAAGWKDAAQIQKDKDLDYLRDRDDFKKLLAELEGKYPARKEQASARGTVK